MKKIFSVSYEIIEMALSDIILQIEIQFGIKRRSEKTYEKKPQKSSYGERRRVFSDDEKL